MVQLLDARIDSLLNAEAAELSEERGMDHPMVRQHTSLLLDNTVRLEGQDDGDHQPPQPEGWASPSSAVGVVGESEGRLTPQQQQQQQQWQQQRKQQRQGGGSYHTITEI